jgi:hypothetical protein
MFFLWQIAIKRIRLVLPRGLLLGPQPKTALNANGKLAPGCLRSCAL